MAAEELGNIYKKIALGKGKSYEFLFSLEGLFLSVMEFDPVTDETLPVTIDDILQGISEFDFQKIRWQNDRLQHIVNFSSSAVRNLIEILHEKNLREHRITRPEQIHEVDSRSMMWLAKKPGFSIKQKIASEQRMMGVYHTTSLDTAENRLFKAFMLKLDELLLEKENACRKQNLTLSEDSERFVSIVHRWLKSDEASFIGKWNNTVPNNTLLNDKNYRKIWKAHLALQNLDEQIQEDLERLQIIKNNALFWISAAKLNLSDDIRFRQTVAFPDYSTFSLIKDRIGLFGFARDDSDNQWKKFTVSLDEKFLLSLQENQSEYSLPDDVENFEGISCFSEQVVANFFPNKSFDAEVAKSLNSQKDSLSVNSVAAVDLNSVLPSYLCDNGNGVKRFTKKLIHQQIKELPCTSSRSKLIFTKSKSIQTFSIHSVFDANLRSVIDSDEDKRGIEKACADFAETIKQETLCQKCIYITSDDIDDFSPTVNAFKQSMNSAFLKTEILPKSIAALFSKYSDILNKFIDGDVLTVRSIYDDYEVQTKVRIRFDKELSEKNPKTKGITFQRLGVTRLENPNTDLERNNIIPQNMKRIITRQDSVLLSGNFSVDSFHFEIKEKPNKIPHGQNEICLYTFENSASGALEYDRLQSITSEIPLWCDFLPKLSMVDSSGNEYVLVKPDEVSIRPIVRKPVHIPISWTFSFPAGKKFYEFPLSQGEKKEKSKYFAFIQDSTFPLQKETECRLYLTYTYGEPLPYKLEFIPKYESAEFKSVLVKWENKECEKDLVHISGPEYIQEDSWETLSKEKIKGIKQIDKLDLLLEITQSIAKFGWKTYRIVDYIGSRNKPVEEASVFLLNNSITKRAICFKNNFPPNYNIQIGTEINCSLIPSINFDGTPRFDKYGQRGLQAYGAIIGGWEEKSNYFYYTLPLINMWNQGRSSSDSDFPKELFIIIKELSDKAVLLLQNPATQKSVKEEVCGMLASLHKDSPKELYDYLNMIIERTLSGDHEEPESLFHHKRLINAFGFAIGNMDLTWQKDLLNKIVNLFDRADEDMRNYGIEILGVALWRTRNCVANLSVANIEKMLPAVIQAIEDFLKFYKSKILPAMKNTERFENDNFFSIQVWIKRKLFLRSVELLLALYRVRCCSSDDEILKLVAPTKENKSLNKLKAMFSDMEKFCKDDEDFSKSYNNKKKYRPLVSRLQFNIDTETSIPNYLYVLEKYTRGEDCRIKILRISDDFD